MDATQQHFAKDGAARATDGDSKLARISCFACSKAKHKCVRVPGEHDCGRCARLGRQCQYRETVRKRRNKVEKPLRTTQLQKLESKIEGLVTALSDKTNQLSRVQGTDRGTTPHTQQTPQAEGTYPTPQSPRNSRISEKASSDQRQDEILNSYWQDHGREDAFPAPATKPANNIGNHIELNMGVSFSEANILVERYQQSMAHAMPFVVLPKDNTTAQQLSADRPVLLQAIVTVAHFHDLAKQQAMVNKLTRDITERIVLYNENKSLDVLQAILVFINWYYPHVLWARQVISLLHLAMSMTEDMHMDRKYGGLMSIKQVDEPQDRSTNEGEQFPSGVGELRALVGVYYLTSMLSTSVRTMGPAPWTRTIEDALKALEINPQSELDDFLVQMVRVQHLMQEAWTCIHTSAGARSSLPVQMFMQAFKANLDRHRRNAPCKDEPRLLRMHYSACEIVIWELSLQDLQTRKDEPELLHSRLECLGRCIESIKAYVDIFLQIPSDEYLALPYSVYGQWAHVVITMVKFVSLDLPGWDMTAFRDQLDVPKLIEETAERFENTATCTVDGVRVNNNSIWTWGRRQRKMGLMCGSKMRPGHGKVSQSAGPGSDTISFAGADNQAHAADDVLSGDFLYNMDDDFWQSFAGNLDMDFL